ncbi:MAG TPA: putative toxin-antitoxin system toxin component, PIN family [bacterium]|nr:putative toxin-antitoxin system toxin component, PIN family [bacterium]
MVNKLFIDANILISALVFPHGTCGKALKKVLERGIKLVVSDYVLFEVKKVLSEKFPKVSLDKLEDFIELANIEILESPPIEEILRYTDKISDKNDIPILAVCIKYNIPLISGDKAFQEESIKQMIKVISCSELLGQDSFITY